MKVQDHLSLQESRIAYTLIIKKAVLYCIRRGPISIFRFIYNEDIKNKEKKVDGHGLVLV